MKLEKNTLQQTFIRKYTTAAGTVVDIPLSYQIFGRPLHTAPVVMINHALTGNSDVAGENGWWKTLVGDNRTIDTQHYTIISFNIPGNGFDGFFISDYQHYTAKDIASLFLLGLEQIGVHKLDILIGGSVGGSIGWEMLEQKPSLAEIFVPVATDYKTSDWLHSQCLIQKFLLESNDQPLEKARIHAMLCYRTPESLNFRFRNEKDAQKKIRKSEDWLNYHGHALSERFSLNAYRLMNHLLMNINGNENELRKISASIHLISVDTDLFYPASEIRKTFDLLKNSGSDVYYHEISSIHGHDAFLIEYDQLNTIFNTIITK